MLLFSHPYIFGPERKIGNDKSEMEDECQKRF